MHTLNCVFIGRCGNKDILPMSLSCVVPPETNTLMKTEKDRVHVAGAGWSGDVMVAPDDWSEHTRGKGG